MRVILPTNQLSGHAGAVHFALTLCGYLGELRAALEAASSTSDDPYEKVQALTDAFVDYSLAYPAFVDCALTLMRRTGEELFGEISEHVMFKLGVSIAEALQTVIDTLDHGVARGEFFIKDTTLTANLLYASGLGAVQLARVGILVKSGHEKLPEIGPLTADDVRRHLVAVALAFTRPFEDN
ncbi:MAG: hypothetical protein V9G04_06430 [Nocardioides sp.]|jgi:hypothetical protein